ncbi:MAG: class I SAM-dependent methyltransferase [Chitinophagales bacterium]|nr:class I SAM-dependent methyltransferase [Chitinophagales bacterium]
MKDIFSAQSEAYAKFRPKYPPELFDFLYQQIPEFKTAWDCGTGNGQVAVVLSKKFDKVFATDISENQIRYAIKKENITYKIEPAEQTNFSDHLFNLITVAQAIHWFDFEKFYAKVYRTLKSRGLIAVIGYHLCRVNAAIDCIIDDFYNNTLCNYWDFERKYIDEKYQTISFPFKEIIVPVFSMQYNWSLNDLIGYLNTWSAVQHFIEKNNYNPVNDLQKKLIPLWIDQRSVSFPLICRLGMA